MEIIKSKEMIGFLVLMLCLIFFSVDNDKVEMENSNFNTEVAIVTK